MLAILCPCTVSLGALWVPPPGASGHILWLQGLSLFPEEAGLLWGAPKTAVPRQCCRSKRREAEQGSAVGSITWSQLLCIPPSCFCCCSHLFHCQGSEGYPVPSPSISTASRHIWSRWLCCS